MFISKKNSEAIINNFENENKWYPKYFPRKKEKINYKFDLKIKEVK